MPSNPITRRALTLGIFLLTSSTASAFDDETSIAGTLLAGDARPLVDSLRRQADMPLLRAVDPASTEVPVRHLDIVFSWATFGGHTREHYVVTATPERYALEGEGTGDSGAGELADLDWHTSARATVIQDTLAALVHTLRWPADTDTGKAMQRAAMRFSRENLTACEDKQTLATVTTVMTTYYQGGWTDDYPQFNLVVTLADGKTIEASSDSQVSPPLPWKVNGVETWNERLPDAIADLLPGDSRMARRLVGPPGIRDLSHYGNGRNHPAFIDLLRRCVAL